MGAIDLATATWLAGTAGQKAIALAAEARGAAPLDLAGAAGALARTATHLSATERASALAQVELRERAAHKYEIDASNLLLTRDGLEQATRPAVSRARIAMLGLTAGSRVLDATAGLGFDATAFISAGLQVTAVERDPVTACLLRANLPTTAVLEADITDPRVLERATATLSSEDLVFFDPARRSGTRSADGARALPERDPERWSPPWSFVQGLASRFRVCAKVAPGFPPWRVPEGWQAAWIATHDGPVEACLLSWPALTTTRRACVISGAGVHQGDIGQEVVGQEVVRHDQVVHIDDDGLGASPVARAGTWLHEPAQVVTTADLIDALARRTGLDRIGRDTHWLTSDGPIDSPASTGLLASYRVLDEVPTAPKSLRAFLRSRGIKDVTIKSRGSRLDASGWRDRLRLPEGPSAILVFLECAGTTHAYLVQRHH